MMGYVLRIKNVATINTITYDIGERAIKAYVQAMRTRGHEVDILIPYDAEQFYMEMGRKIFRIFAKTVNGHCAHHCYFYNAAVPQKNCCNFGLAGVYGPGEDCPYYGA